MHIQKAWLWGFVALIVSGSFTFPGFFHSSYSFNTIDILQSTPNGPPFTLFSRGETWRYFAGPAEPDPTWPATGFNDSAWKSGQAPLGYGVGEITMVDSGPDPNNKYITTYFRKSFHVDDPRAFNSLTLDLLHSDGVFIYLNGNLIDYPHMGSEGPVYNAYAIACDNGETDTIGIEPARLVAGENVLAVEVHTCKPDSQFLVLDAGLAGTIWSTPPTATSRPSATPTLTPTAAPTLIIPEAAGFPLFGKAETWRYFDLGRIPGDGWMSTNFDDSAWKSGPAPFGYGGVGRATTIGYGPDPAHKHTTTYFRKEFTIDNHKQALALSLELVSDDGAVAYLNGTMIAHPNMPAGGIGNTTVPSSCGNAIATTVAIDPGLLLEGKNVFALEQHQCDAGAMNMIVDASLGAKLNNGRPKPANFPRLTSLAAPRPEPEPTTRPMIAAKVTPDETPVPVGAILPPAESGQKWALRWSDEFDGTSVNTKMWKINNKARAEDPNKTWYSPNNVSVSNGTLKLLVKQEAYKNANYTGAMLDSTGDYRRNRYGYYEARIKYDFVGPGFWANFWLCGVDRWPPEIDNEIVTQRQGQVYLANHYRDSAAVHRSTNTFVDLDYTQWHTYGVLWLPGQPIQFYIDGKLAFTADSPAENPPSIDMYVSLRAGAFYDSSWGGAPDGSTKYPGTAEYDYVRVYQAVNQ